MPGADREVGDGFLLKRGFTIVAVGWEFDTGRGNGQITLDAPIATDNGRAINGIAHATFVPDRADPTMAVGDLAGYPSIDPAGADSLLTVRDAFQATGTPIARDKWQLSGNSVTLTGGFEPGKLPAAGALDDGKGTEKLIFRQVRHTPRCVCQHKPGEVQRIR